MNTYKYTVIGFFIAFFASCIGSAFAGVTEQILFERKKDGYNNIRIPAIVKTNAGTLLAFAEGREAGDTGKIQLIMRRSKDSGQSWSDIQIIWQDGNNTCGNPAPLVDRDTGTIWLFMTWNFGSDNERAIKTGQSKHPRKVFLCKSTDDGKHWSTPKEMPHLRKEPWRWYATGPANGIQLTRGPHKGRLICPANHSDKATPKRQNSTYRSHIIYSDDHGKTWQLGGVHEILTNESTVAELEDGSVIQNMRSYHGKGNRAVAVSKDGGESFEKLYLDDALKSPVCQASILRFSWEADGQGILLFSSPSDKKRTGMMVRMSFDDGKTWPASKLIYKKGSAYSNLIKLSDDTVGLLYEKDGYSSITFATFPLSDIE